jgi:hypothetical protein
MGRKFNLTIAALIALLSFMVIYVPAQDRRAAAGKARAHRSYSPRIIGRSDSFIVEGRVVAVRSGGVVIKTTKGARLGFAVDDETALLESTEVVSIATMADISLSLTDLRPADRVEVVAERRQGESVARIITRITAGREQVANR